MKFKFNIPFLILLVITLLLLFKDCGGSDKPTNHSIDTKAIAKTLKRQLTEKETLKKLALIELDTVVKWKDRWHKAKDIHDTIPCPKKLTLIINVGDSLISKMDKLVTLKDSIQNKSDSIIGNYQKVVRADSLTIEQLKPRQTLYLGVDATTNGNVFPSIGLDTKKAVFIAGYDPFNKQLKAGVYFKIKLWKRN